MLQIYGDNTIEYASVTPSTYQGTVKPFTLCGKGNYELTVYIHTTDNASWSKLDNIVTNANEFYSPFKIIIINTYPGKEARMELTNPNRPTENLVEGFEYYDSTLKKKILWNGTEWTNLDGSALS